MKSRSAKKIVPIDVTITPEFIEKNRVGGQGKEDEDTLAEILGGDRVEAIRKYEVTKRLEYAIACKLDLQGYVAAKPIKVIGIITGFRLRNPSVLFFPIARATSGSDILALKVDVMAPGDDKPYQFTARHAMDKAGFRMTVPSQRLNYMVQIVAKDITRKILKSGLFKEPYSTSPGDQSASMGDAITKGNSEVLRRITNTLSKQKEPVETVLLDRVADRIYFSQNESDGGMADSLAHMCKLLGKSNNGKYKRVLLEVSEKAAHKTVRKHAGLAANSLPDTSEENYVPKKLVS